MGRASCTHRQRGPLALIALQFCLLAIACSDPTDEVNEHALQSDVAEDSIPAEHVPEAEDVVYPAPISRPAMERAEPSLAPTDLRTRLHLIPSAELLVIDGVVAQLEAQERQFTGEHFETTVGTKTAVDVSSVLCGAAPGDGVDFTYLAGRVGDKSFYSSLMPSDLRVGERYVFVLRKNDNEFLLEMGRADLHKVVSADLVEVYGTGIVPRQIVQESCP